MQEDGSFFYKGQEEGSTEAFNEFFNYYGGPEEKFSPGEALEPPHFADFAPSEGTTLRGRASIMLEQGVSSFFGLIDSDDASLAGPSALERALSTSYEYGQEPVDVQLMPPFSDQQPLMEEYWQSQGQTPLLLTQLRLLASQNSS